MLLDEFYKYMSTGDCDPDNILVSASHAKRYKRVKSENHSKVWRIDVNQAKNTLNTTT